MLGNDGLNKPLLPRTNSIGDRYIDFQVSTKSVHVVVIITGSKGLLTCSGILAVKYHNKPPGAHLFPLHQQQIVQIHG